MKEVARQTADSCWVNRPSESEDKVLHWWLQCLKEQMPVLQTGQTRINLHNRLHAHCALEEIVCQATGSFKPPQHDGRAENPPLPHKKIGKKQSTAAFIFESNQTMRGSMVSNNYQSKRGLAKNISSNVFYCNKRTSSEIFWF